MSLTVVMPSKHSEVGVTMVANGTFASDTGWTKGNGWSIADDKASCDGSQAATSFLVNDNAVVAGKQYRTEFTVSGFDTGTVRIRLGSVSGATRGANGTYVQVITAGGTQLDMRANSTFIGSVENVSVKLVTYR